LLAVQKNFDALKFIKKPYKSVQIEAVTISYEALRYIKEPVMEAELIGIQNNEGAIQFLKEISKEKILLFLKTNILVVKYVLNDITKAELEEILKEVLGKEDVDETYVRDFIRYHSLDDSILNEIDKIAFLYHYGSKKAKQIAVDERLKL
jgi:hypothetical protein